MQFCEISLCSSNFVTFRRENLRIPPSLSTASQSSYNKDGEIREHAYPKLKFGIAPSALSSTPNPRVDRMASKRVLYSTPTQEEINASEFEQFRVWLGKNRGIKLADYWEAHRWSTQCPGDYWTAAWDYLGIIGSVGEKVSFTPRSRNFGLLPPRTLFLRVVASLLLAVVVRWCFTRQF